MAALNRKPLDREALAGAADCVNMNFRRASRLLSGAYAQTMAPTGLSDAQFTLLVTVGVAGRIDFGDVARFLATDPTTLTRNTRLLERAGYLRKTPGKDRRLRELSLTPEGERVLAEAFELWKVAQARVIERIGAKRWAALRRELDAVVEVLRDA
ncbi:MAG: MarR family transcriptional regulator [Myxococcales bacterium]|nr:MarR family transcriptional regulator [Myxococcales bacterium]